MATRTINFKDKNGKAQKAEVFQTSNGYEVYHKGKKIGEANSLDAVEQVLEGKFGSISDVSHS